MGREVPVPLAREPEVLWGLTVGDLIWPAAAVVVDVALWHWSRGWGNGRWLVVGAVSR
ncbi:protein of unknown function [Candidatus Hydrogenisulfobacillus filiaventi]|uniref:Uncharacterized protein n=1 Tax=Candidatus Hydrogenisulfobacillus filiaventi TaxID=2707344 RepID=A0A6F8ZI24_9FIRM|nr:protein of unknown function [Candidatus Hydrogenisulfobacillus filiaventi]